jgi:hypothetical protein
MPFTHIGFPIGTIMPSIIYLSTFIERNVTRLSPTYTFLSYGDKLVLVNSILSTLWTFFMLTLMIPVGVTDVVDRDRRHCLWTKMDKLKFQSLEAWDMICKPKKNSGLGIRVQNVTLLLNHLHKFYNNDPTHIIMKFVPHVVVLWSVCQTITVLSQDVRWWVVALSCPGKTCGWINLWMLNFQDCFHLPRIGFNLLRSLLQWRTYWNVFIHLSLWKHTLSSLSCNRLLGIVS